VELGDDADVLVDELIINLSLALFHLFYNVQTFLGLCESKSDYIWFWPIQHQKGRSHRYSVVVSAKATLDMIIVNIPEGLPIPIVSIPANVVTPWNKFEESFLEPIFVFAEDCL
jgi:hypothetical protein